MYWRYIVCMFSWFLYGNLLNFLYLLILVCTYLLPTVPVAFSTLLHNCSLLYPLQAGTRLEKKYDLCLVSVRG